MAQCHDYHVPAFYTAFECGEERAQATVITFQRHGFVISIIMPDSFRITGTYIRSARGSSILRDSVRTHVMYTPFIWILTSGLVLKE